MKDKLVYVSDSNNRRVMKWNKGSKEGIAMAGGQGYESALTQFYGPQELCGDTSGTLYVVEFRERACYAFAERIITRQDHYGCCSL